MATSARFGSQIASTAVAGIRATLGLRGDKGAGPNYARGLVRALASQPGRGLEEIADLLDPLGVRRFLPVPLAGEVLQELADEAVVSTWRVEGQSHDGRRIEDLIASGGGAGIRVVAETVVLAGAGGLAGAGEAGAEAAAEAATAGTEGGARFITNSAGSTLDLRTFVGLVRNADTVSVGRGGAGRALSGAASSYTLTSGAHALVYGPEGRLMYDVSASRIKAFQWSQAPSGQWFARTGSNLKFNPVPQAVLSALGL